METSADRLLDTEWWRATDAELLTALGQAERVLRRVYASTLAILTEAGSRGVTGGYDGTRALVHDIARISIVEATRREKHADLLEHSPATREAVEEGLLGPDHLDVISRTLAAIPSDVDPEHRNQAEETLVEHARTLDARALKNAGRRILAWLDQYGREPRDEPMDATGNELHLHTGRDGRLRLTGRFGPEDGALLAGLLSPLAKPRPVDGTRDLRSPAERSGDAFADLLRLMANAAEAPVEGGERPHLTVTVSLRELRDQVGYANLAGVGELASLSPRQLRRLACDAHVTPMVLDSDSQPLDVGRSKRTAPPGLRKGLVWRDGGCAFPGCDRPARWCDSHHARHWIDGGPTKLDNMVLLCRRHHTLIHSSDWEVRIRDRLPEFLPPAFIDPERKPRRNNLHGVRPLRRRTQRSAASSARTRS
jgi:hypothetical protein